MRVCVWAWMCACACACANPFVVPAPAGECGCPINLYTTQPLDLCTCHSYVYKLYDVLLYGIKSETCAATHLLRGRNSGIP